MQGYQLFLEYANLFGYDTKTTLKSLCVGRMWRRMKIL